MTHGGRSIAIIGGGITGLAAAHRLTELAPESRVVLFEAADRLGGVLETERHDGYLLELSADNFITNVPWGIDLCRRVGIGDELLRTRESERRAFVVRQERLLPVPLGFHLLAPGQLWPVVRSPLLSWRGKLRVLGELLVPRRRTEDDESLASFARRRLGREAFERLVQPLVAGIYTADAERLSMAAALPRFVEMERRWGSLIWAAWNDRRQSDASASSGARYGLFVAPHEGLSSLVRAIAARLPEGCVRTGTAVKNIALADGKWSLSAGDAVEQFDALVLALPAPAAARLLENVDGELAGELRKIPYAGSAIVALGYRHDQLARPLEGFGFVVPAIERREVLAASYSSVKFEGRAADDRLLIRVFFGGADRPDQLDFDDDKLIALAREELGELIGARGDPELARVVRWPASMPQYHVGHLQIVERIERACQSWPTLALAGNAYRGVGVPNCIHSGELAAQKVCEVLGLGS